MKAQMANSAGHYNREYGLVCEQWTPAAKARP
jgi:hypothetical protein